MKVLRYVGYLFMVPFVLVRTQLDSGGSRVFKRKFWAAHGS